MQNYVDLVDSAPPWSRDMSLQLGHLARQHVCIPALIASILQDATDLAQSLHTKSIITPEGQAYFHQTQGGIVALKALSDRIITQMSGNGFPTEEEEEAYEEEPSETSTAPPRRMRPSTPQPKPKPKAKKAVKKTRR